MNLITRVLLSPIRGPNPMPASENTKYVEVAVPTLCESTDLTAIVCPMFKMFP